MTGLPDSIRVLERDWLSSNQVLMIDDNGATVVDTGYVKHAPLTVELVAWGLAGRPLSRIVNTHLHSDHCGGNASLQRRFGCTITIPAACADAVDAWDEGALSYRDTAQQCERFLHDDTIAAGDVIEGGGLRWQVHAAPGHDPTSVILFEPTHRVLMSADALWEHGFGVIFPELAGESGFAEQQAVLDLIERLDPAIVLPGHGPMFTDVHAAVKRARSRLAALRGDVRRNARHALKVLIKYQLLARERVLEPVLFEELRGAKIMVDSARLAGMQTDEALAWAVSELTAPGLIRRDGPWLVDATGIR